jgi:hypothetical protein
MTEPSPSTALEICLSALVPIGVVLSLRLPPTLAKIGDIFRRVRRRKLNASGLKEA